MYTRIINKEIPTRSSATMLKEPDGCTRRGRRKSRERMANYGKLRQTAGYGAVCSTNNDTPESHHKWRPVVVAVGKLYLCFLAISILGRLSLRGNIDGSTPTGVLGEYENFANLSLPWKAMVVIVGLPLYGAIEIVPYELTQFLCYAADCIASARTCTGTLGRRLGHHASLEYTGVPRARDREYSTQSGQSD